MGLADYPCAELLDRDERVDDPLDIALHEVAADHVAAELNWTELSPWHKFVFGNGPWRAAKASAAEHPGDAKGTKEQI